jgi:hypothetical protein
MIFASNLSRFLELRCNSPSRSLFSCLPAEQIGMLAFAPTCLRPTYRRRLPGEQSRLFLSVRPFQDGAERAEVIQLRSGDFTVELASSLADAVSLLLARGWLTLTSSVAP